MESQTKKRVKVYQLGKGNEWNDQGTGHCSCEFNEDKSEGTLVVHSEDEEDRELLRSRIKTDDVYQKQQDTLIVWSEDDIDLALSFQEAEGCSEIWETINEVRQQHADDACPALVDGNGTNNTLPDPDISNLKDIGDLLRAAQRDILEREKLSSFVLVDNYINKLFPLLETLEGHKSIAELQLLYYVMLGIIQLHDIAVIQYILQEGIFLNCVGILEYEPGLVDSKPDYRGFLMNRVKFKQIVPIKDLEVEQKIHKVFRLHFLRDTVLSRVMDDGLPSILGSLIFFNNNDIVNAICQNRPFLLDLFAIMDANNNHSDEMHEQRRDVVRFAQQFCSIARSTHMTARIYRTLCQCGLFNVFTFSFTDSEGCIKMAGIEIMLSVLEYDASLVRSHIVKQAENPSDQQIFGVIVEQFLVERDVGAITQLSELIRMLLNTSPYLTECASIQATIQSSSRLDPDADKFLELFYSLYVDKLMSPLLDLPEDTVILDRVTSIQCESICTILSFMVRQHSFRSKYYVFTSGVITKSCSLLSNRDLHLGLTVLKFLRACIEISDEFYHRYLIDRGVINSIVELLLRNNNKNNLLNSVCLEFFEFIRTENFETLSTYLTEKYSEELREITYVDTFIKLMAQHKQLQQHQQQQHLQQQTQAPVAIVNFESEVSTKDEFINNKDCKLVSSDKDSQDFSSKGGVDAVSERRLDNTPDASHASLSEKDSDIFQHKRASHHKLEDTSDSDGNDPSLERKENEVAASIERGGELDKDVTSSQGRLTVVPTHQDPNVNAEPSDPIVTSNGSIAAGIAKKKTPPLVSTSMNLSLPISTSPFILSPLPVSTGRTSIVFVRTGSQDSQDVGQQHSPRDVNKTQTDMQLMNGLATGSATEQLSEETSAVTPSLKRRDNEALPDESRIRAEPKRKTTGDDNDMHLSLSEPTVLAASPRQDHIVAVINELDIKYALDSASINDSTGTAASVEERIDLSRGSTTPLRVLVNGRS
ncbi:component of IIS longevity pathway SMK-1-domain-containing protein [Lobosporangium transversale]|uniref:Component of IIS longevity pathway SMK-1-domain-containing protein n=1 Tax=Lobosporangium transversale TaxID=64571 RepID=A0A1Y2H1W1_9FUNG|nr:component of IIS longevity pathway SMK-1-domain-containing protein [Lobosporangium transversale]ORZ27022.1 component of IIS longevity pathway SMK-1-domain-containing protein [Lobosporangium transversale]|eukprot:XP_021884769.1 component of IIS longevity pathway SMK-1-domain-containing protein [Lobosporangium transversale]